MAFEYGVILPNFGSGATPEGLARVADAAERVGFHSVWTTEHLLVGPEAVDPYGTVLDSLTVLSWLVGLTERVALGTSIVILPLHHPMRLAKESATLQQLSGGRLKLGVGVGWHEDEFRFFGVPFAERGRRTTSRSGSSVRCGAASRRSWASSGRSRARRRARSPSRRRRSGSEVGRCAACASSATSGTRHESRRTSFVR